MDQQIPFEVADEVELALLEGAEATVRTVEIAPASGLIQIVRSDSTGSWLRRRAGAFASDMPGADLRHVESLGRILGDELRDEPDA